jgi:hypothetical protein
MLQQKQQNNKHDLENRGQTTIDLESPLAGRVNDLKKQKERCWIPAFAGMTAGGIEEAYKSGTHINRHINRGQTTIDLAKFFSRSRE